MHISMMYVYMDIICIYVYCMYIWMLYEVGNYLMTKYKTCLQIYAHL